MLPRPLVTVLTVLVTLAWSVNVVYGFIDPAKHDPTLNAIFGIVVGGVFALRNTTGKHASKVRAELGHWIAGESDGEIPDPAEPDEHTGDTP